LATTWQGTASFVAYGLLEEYNPDSVKIPRDILRFRAGGRVSGYSADPQLAPGPPGPDPQVAAINAKMGEAVGKSISMTQKFWPRGAQDIANGEPLEQYNELGVALHGFGLGVKRRVITDEERARSNNVSPTITGVGNNATKTTQIGGMSTPDGPRMAARPLTGEDPSPPRPPKPCWSTGFVWMVTAL
jgi:hypothetical protein